MSPFEQLLDPTNPLNFLILFLLIWILACYLLSIWGGWSRLAGDYRTDADIDGSVWRFQSGALRYGLRYNGCLTIGASPSGLHLRILFLFRMGHPPLFIPWSDIKKSGDSGRWRGQKFLLSPTDPVSFTISQRLVERIEQAKGQSIDQH